MGKIPHGVDDFADPPDALVSIAKGSRQTTLDKVDIRLFEGFFYFVYHLGRHRLALRRFQQLVVFFQNLLKRLKSTA